MIFKIVFVLSIISIAMLNSYSNYLEKNNINDLKTNNLNFQSTMIKGNIINIYESNNSVFYELSVNNTIKVLSVKNKLFKNTSLKKGDFIIVEADFKNLNEILNKTYFARQIIQPIE